MRTLPLLFSFMIGIALLGSPTVGFAQMIVPPSASNTLAVTNPLVTLGTAINTTGSVNINSGTNQLTYCVYYSYLIMGQQTATSINPAIINAVLPANSTIPLPLAAQFTPTVRGMGYVEIWVTDGNGVTLTRTTKMISVQ